MSALLITLGIVAYLTIATLTFRALCRIWVDEFGEIDAGDVAVSAFCALLPAGVIILLIFSDQKRIKSPRFARFLRRGIDHD